MALIAPLAQAQGAPSSQHFGVELCPPGPCATADADRDGVLDEYDACPTEPETFNDFEDGDGCPDREGAQLAEQTQQVLFETGSHRLRRTSFTPLSAIAKLASGSRGTDSQKIEVTGYADERGTDEANQVLSQQRADAVLAWLVAHAVHKDRLVAVGHGELPGRDASTMRVNRRVEVRLQPSAEVGARLAADAPDVRFRSGWAIAHDSESGKVELVSSTGVPCRAFAVVRRGERVAIYARCVTGHETEVALEKKEGALAHAFLRVRTPTPEGGWTAGAVSQHWEDWEYSPAVPGATPPATQSISPLVVARGQKHPGAIALYGTTIYVAVDGGIVQMPKAGGTPTPTLLGVKPSSLAADGSDLYWVEGDKVMRAFKDGGGPLTVAMGQKGPADVAIHSNYVYWVNTLRAEGGQASVSRGLRHGFGAALVSAAPSPTRLAVNDVGVFYLSPALGSVVRVTHGAVTPIVLATEQFDAKDIAVDDRFVYWVGSGGVRKVPIAGGSVIQISATAGRRLVLDTTHVFWITGQPEAPSGDGIARIAKAGGHQGAIGSEGAADLAVDDSRLYWTRTGVSDSDGAVLALPKH